MRIWSARAARDVTTHRVHGAYRVEDVVRTDLAALIPGACSRGLDACPHVETVIPTDTTSSQHVGAQLDRQCEQVERLLAVLEEARWITNAYSMTSRRTTSWSRRGTLSFPATGW